MKYICRNFIILFIPFFPLVISNCSDDSSTSLENGTSIHAPNKPPDTWLSVSTINISEAELRIHFNWGGSDIDGEVIYYQWTISIWDTIYDWYNIDRSDSIFIIPNYHDPYDLPPSDFIFYIRAIDDDLRMDSTPASCSFDY